MTHWLTVIGIGEDGVEGLGPEARAALAKAEAVFGGSRHLALAGETPGAERIAWPSPFDAAFPLIAARRGRPVVVLASGDPMFYGVGAALMRQFSRAEMRILPHPSSFSLAAARMGWPLQAVRWISVHGRPLELVIPHLLPGEVRAPNKMGDGVDTADLVHVVPGRPPGFCIGCPERPIFAATKLVEQELGKHHIASDIGCHLFSIMPPFELGATTMGYGLGPASASAFNSPDAKRRSISFVGDGGFWHNGLTSSVGNAVFNKNDGVIVIVDNFYSAATGGQDILSSRASNKTKSTKHPITEAVKGMGVKWLRHIDRTYDVGKMQETLREALTTEEKGPKVIVASSECMLNRQRRERPVIDKAIKGGERVVKPKFGVDEDICTGDHACMRLSGCPSLSVKSLDDPLRDDPVASIDQNCVGCGNCGEVADAAVLCPSFYRADVVHNPTGWDRFLERARRAVIDLLQRRRENRRLVFADA